MTGDYQILHNLQSCVIVFDEVHLNRIHQQHQSLHQQNESNPESIEVSWLDEIFNIYLFTS